MTAVAVGLRLGSRGSLRAAVVYAAPGAAGAKQVAWQVVVFDEDQGFREPVAGVDVDVLARAPDASAQARGLTNADGVAEVLLGLSDATGADIEVRSGAAVLAHGNAQPQPPLPAAQARTTTTTQNGWLRFARREGAIALDVAVLGQRAAPGVPAEIWIRATDAKTAAPMGGVAVTLENDTSLTPDPLAAGAQRTDSRGWARMIATPVGLAVTLTLHARSADARSGEWIGGLFMSPGAPSVDVARRVDPGIPFALSITMPTLRSAAYLEIEDARGRAWAAAAAPISRPDGSSATSARVPGLAPGLYWAVGAADPASGATLSAGTIVRPFFVAASDEAALPLGSDRGACASSSDPRELPNAVSSCLALSAIVPTTRWVALDGFVTQRALDHEARVRGLAVALGALAIAVVLEALLLLRAAVAGRARTVAVAVLVGLLGFALLAAFIVRV
jgi:hypothetical protein